MAAIVLTHCHFDETRMCPEHGPESTIDRERCVKPFFLRA